MYSCVYSTVWEEACDSGDCVQVNLQDSKGTTLLHRAASDGRVNCVRVLLDNKADSTAKVSNICYSLFVNPVFYIIYRMAKETLPSILLSFRKLSITVYCK